MTTDINTNPDTHTDHGSLDADPVDAPRQSQHDSQRHVQRRVRLRIPKDYHQDPIISQLVSQYAVTVNIVAALLDTHAKGDGWFDLDLQGSERQITSALTFINDLNVEILDEHEADGW